MPLFNVQELRETGLAVAGHVARPPVGRVLFRTMGAGHRSPRYFSDANAGGPIFSRFEKEVEGVSTPEPS